MINQKLIIYPVIMDKNYLHEKFRSTKTKRLLNLRTLTTLAKWRVFLQTPKKVKRSQVFVEELKSLFGPKLDKLNHGENSKYQL